MNNQIRLGKLPLDWIVLLLFPLSLSKSSTKYTYNIYIFPFKVQDTETTNLKFRPLKTEMILYWTYEWTDRHKIFIFTDPPSPLKSQFYSVAVVRVSVEMKLLLVISLMLGYSICHEDINQTFTEPRTPLQRIWIANSIVGVFGIILNGYVLLTFFQDRHKLVTSVNAMIMYLWILKSSHYGSFSFDTL